MKTRSYFRPAPRTVADSEGDDGIDGEEFFDDRSATSSTQSDEAEFFDAKSDLGEDGLGERKQTSQNKPKPTKERRHSFSTKEGKGQSQRKDPWSNAASHQGVPFQFHSRLGHRIDFVQLKSPDKLTHLQHTFVYRLFGDRLVMYKMDLTKNQGDMPPHYVEAANGCKYEILGSKWQKKMQENIPKKELTLFYVLVEGPGIPTINVQATLEALADFGSLPPSKVPSRLELLLSTAQKSTMKERDCLIFDDLSASRDFEMIPEDSNVGCGFVPREYLTKFLGAKARGTRTFAIQVRIFSPKLGAFKGMLMEKPGIQKIQLPPSMQKVGPSLLDSTSDYAAVLINNLYPSNKHLQVSRVLDEDKKKPSVSYRPNKLKWMLTSLWKSLGVTEETIDEYVQDSCVGYNKDLQHSCVVGVADPTNALPPGHIFVTGVLGTDADLPNVFVTRFPCTEQRDGLLLPLVSSKPDKMTQVHWDFLCNLPFGAIVFGNALPGTPSLPSIVAHGDLDGDNYFVCWSRRIIDQIQPVPPAEGEFDDGILQTCPRNENWFDDVQSGVSNVSGLARLHDLIGKLCTLRKKLVQDCGAECPDAEAFGRAYKDSLEVAKHGTRIRLPRRLWDMLAENLHCLLEDDGTAQSCPFGNDDGLASLEEGAPIEIIGGTYKKQTGTFVRLTPKMVCVRISGQRDDTRLSRKNVRPTRPS